MPNDLPDPARLSLEFAFRAEVMVEPALEVGLVAGVGKRVIPILGGTIHGPRLSGRILAGGADWQDLGPDQTAWLCARYVVRANDGTLISVTNTGIRRAEPDILARIMAGDLVDPALYYFRTTPRFEVADGPHRWLGENVFVCSAARTKNRVLVDFHLVG